MPRSRVRHIVTALITAGLLSQAPTAAALEQYALPELPEVQVKGRHVQLARLREEMIRLEDQFYAAYNALNDDDRFDVHCTQENPTGSRVGRRFCRAGCELRAQQAEGNQYYWAMFEVLGGDSNNMVPVADWVPPLPAIVSIESQRQQFRQHMRNVMYANPELLGLLQQRDELARHYEKLRRGRFAGSLRRSAD